MHYRYVAVDIDGTLLDDHDRYDQVRLTKDICALRRQNVTFLIASGNSLDALKTQFGKLVNNFVAENGGRVVVAGHEIRGVAHRPETLAKLLDYIHCLPQPDLLSLSAANQTMIPQKFASVPVPYYPHHAYFKRLVEIREPVYNVNVNWYQRQLPLDQIQQIARTINRTFPEVNATYSGAYGIDILPRGVNKARGLRKFVQHTGGSMDQVVAVGDTSNDVEMVSAVGLGLAMRNATPDLQSAAAAVTIADNNHAGLLRAIEALFSL